MFCVCPQIRYWRQHEREAAADRVRTAGLQPTARVSGLRPSTRYNVAVLAYNSAGTGPPSPRTAVTTRKPRTAAVLPWQRTCSSPELSTQAWRSVRLSLKDFTKVQHSATLFTLALQLSAVSFSFFKYFLLQTNKQITINHYYCTYTPINTLRRSEIRCTSFSPS